MSGRLTGRTSEFESEYSGSNPFPTTYPFSPMAEALVSEARKYRFKSYRGYKGEITERGSGLFAKQSVPVAPV